MRRSIRAFASVAGIEFVCHNITALARTNVRKPIRFHSSQCRTVIHIKPVEIVNRPPPVLDADLLERRWRRPFLPGQALDRAGEDEEIERRLTRAERGRVGAMARGERGFAGGRALRVVVEIERAETREALGPIAKTHRDAAEEQALRAVIAGEIVPS